jgi:hypothetical protein
MDFNPSDFDAFLANPSQETIPKCSLCGEILRPHVLWFDESYDAHHDFRFTEAVSRVDESDIVIALGTSLQVGIAKYIRDATRCAGIPFVLIDPFLDKPPLQGVKLINQTADELVAWGTDMMAAGRLHKILVGPMSVNPWLGKAEIDKEPERFGYSIVSSTNTPNQRFVGEEVQWQTDQYCWSQAVADSNRCTTAFLNLEPFPNIQTFNLPFIVSISNSQFKNILFDALMIPRNSARYHLIDKITTVSYKKYQQQYLAKLLS